MAVIARAIADQWSLDEYRAAERAVAEARGAEQRRAALARLHTITAVRREFPLPAEPVKR